jgi:hypothetical protein
MFKTENEKAEKGKNWKINKRKKKGKRKKRKKEKPIENRKEKTEPKNNWRKRKNKKTILDGPRPAPPARVRVLFSPAVGRDIGIVVVEAVKKA